MGGLLTITVDVAEGAAVAARVGVLLGVDVLVGVGVGVVEPPA